MAKCENLEFFSRDACSKVPNPLPDEFRAYCGSVLGRYSASLGQVSTLGRPGPSPFNPGEGQAGPHYSLSLHSEARRFIEAHLRRHDYPEAQMVKNTEFFRVTLLNYN